MNDVGPQTLFDWGSQEKLDGEDLCLL